MSQAGFVGAEYGDSVHSTVVYSKQGCSELVLYNTGEYSQKHLSFLTSTILCVLRDALQNRWIQPEAPPLPSNFVYAQGCFIDTTLFTIPTFSSSSSLGSCGI